MFLNSLFDRVLIEPHQQGATSLYVVSGYATATFANRHLSQLDEFSLSLIVGMPGNRGDHHGWLTLAKRFGQRLTVHYLESSPYVHCKAYGWFQQDRSHSGYTGSANYTQSGFLNGGQVNQMVSDDPRKIKDLYDSLIPRAVDIHDYEEKRAEELWDIPGYSLEGSTLPGGVQWLAPGHAVKVSFLSRNGELPARSGLNWGQRPELGRDPNQAYLPLRKDVRDEGFLPKRTHTFTLVTDDNQAMDCVVAQDGRKAIQSTDDNSVLGSYIRKRMGLESGDFITREDLVTYGRTDFTLVKIDDETILLDFSVSEKS